MASLNDRLADLAAVVAAEKGAEVDRARMADFDAPSYDGDVETGAGIPKPARRFSERLTAADAFLIVSPEYNASMPACSRTRSTGSRASGRSRSTGGRDS